MGTPDAPTPVAGICFDALGTLFDLTPLLDEIDGSVAPGAGRSFADRLGPWAWHATAAGRYQPFPELALDALLAAAREHRVQLRNGAAGELVGRLQRLPLVDGAGDMLRRLQPAQLAVLADGTLEELRALVHSAGVAQRFRHLLAADPVRLFRPAPQAYALASIALGVSSDRVLLVTAHEWDVAGGHHAGLRTVWVSGGRPETRMFGVAADIVVNSMAALPDALADRGLIDFEPGGATIPGRPLPAGRQRIQSPPSQTTT
jgi:2-haloacid dehalogenase